MFLDRVLSGIKDLHIYLQKGKMSIRLITFKYNLRNLIRLMMPLKLVVQFLGKKKIDFNLLLFRVSTVLQGSFKYAHKPQWY